MLIIIEYAYGHSKPGYFAPPPSPAEKCSFSIFSPIKTRPDDWLDVFTVIPVICFGYQCHVSVIPIYSCMKHRNIKHFTIASSAAIAVCCFT